MICRTVVFLWVCIGVKVFLSSPTLRVEHRLRVFEIRMLRRMFVPKRDEATGEWMGSGTTQ